MSARKRGKDTRSVPCSTVAATTPFGNLHFSYCMEDMPSSSTKAMGASCGRGGRRGDCGPTMDGDGCCCGGRASRCRCLHAVGAGGAHRALLESSRRTTLEQWRCMSLKVQSAYSSDCTCACTLARGTCAGSRCARTTHRWRYHETVLQNLSRKCTEYLMI